ncbi:hypothetical protein PCASD_00691 [Puccinia coronata f. sp. avenae]|uniref:Integrase catalytic domain-containing protein n=1 Tax=Puccinia coronata f. sp. avenae TaxID=200324 RepID=A0A2N5S986_9BASI|nr:hypothetical protein PCASD_18164 [Puccinia coronata f. sp. avenae]PLW50665.1 hypothetical protein PCASD_00691 [Puccinia coronata f. sp. avenae]
MECLREFKTIGYDVKNDIFAACIISRVTVIKQTLMDSLMKDEELLSHPFWLLEKLQTFAVHEQSIMRVEKKADSQTNSSSALATNTNSGNGKGKRRVHPCTHGHNPKMGHSQRNFWYNNPDLLPKRFKSNSNQETANVTLVALGKNFNKALEQVDDNETAVPVFGYCCTIANNTLTSKASRLSTILDSGASNHMLNSLDYFINTAPVQVFIVTGDGKSKSELVATRKGTARFCLASGKVLELEEALFVPNLLRNLISLALLTTGDVWIKRTGELYNLIINSEKLLQLRLSNRLYELEGDIFPVGQEYTAMLKLTQEPQSFSLWHNRMGHASTELLKVAIPNIKLLPKEECFVHGDLVGLILPSSNGGGRYFLTLVNQFTGFVHVTILKEKSDACQAFEKFKTFYEKQTGCQLKKLVTDGGGEFCNNTLSALLEAEGIQHNSNLAPEWWAEAVKTACATTNCLPSLSRSRVSPLELLFKKRPNYGFFKTFSCKVWCLKPGVRHKTKFEYLSWEGVLVGYANDYLSYKVVRLDTKEIMPSVKHAYFDEHNFPICSAIHKSLNNLNMSNDLPIFADRVLPFEEIDLPAEEGTGMANADVVSLEEQHLTVSTTPKNHHQAMKGDETAAWREAKEKEYENMKNHNAWVARVKTDKDHPIPLTWVYRKKLGANNEVTEYKARICVQGFQQTFGLHYFLKYAPTGKPCSLRLLISFAVNNNLKIYQLDVKSAFLTCPLEDKVTAVPPPGFVGPSNIIFELTSSVLSIK